MAAPMAVNVARGGLFTFRDDSNFLNLLRSSIRLYAKSNKNKGKSKKSKVSQFDSDGLFNNQSQNAPVIGLGIVGSSKDRTEKRSNANNRAATSGALKFKDILNQRRNEALRSILVRTHHPGTTLQTLHEFGQVEYASFTSDERGYILAQYKDTREVESLMSAGSSLFSASKQFPLQSRLFVDLPHSSSWNYRRKRKALSSESIQPYPQNRMSLSYELKQSFDDECVALDSFKSLKELDLRQRFFLCTLLEDMLQSLLPEGRVLPYGSCLNGFGWWNGDLDMMLSLDLRTHPYAVKPSSQNGEATPFKYLTELFSTERQLAQRTLSAVGGMVELMPLMDRVIRILNARVPIIRFYHRAMSLQCDLSLQAIDSIKMTETLYLLSTADPRVQPLMTTVKQWALHHQLTSSGEHQKPTTLGLLCLLIFYLQSCQPATVLPSLRSLQSLATASSSSQFEIDGVNYRLPASPASIPSSTNTQSIESLLHDFFKFIASFNFEAHGMSLIEGSAFSKPDQTSALYVEYPYRIGFNICRNVSRGCVQSLQAAMKSAAQTMEGIEASRDDDVSRLKVLFGHRVDTDSVHLVIDSLFENEDGDGGEVEVEHNSSRSEEEEQLNGEGKGGVQSLNSTEVVAGSQKESVL